MSLELWNTLASFGTFVVIAITAIAALVQLRHVRSSNQIVAFNELRESSETQEFRQAEHFVTTQFEALMEDPEFRSQILNASARTQEMQDRIMMVRHLAGYFEAMGAMVKKNLIDGNLVFDLYNTRILRYWYILAASTAAVRSRNGLQVYENFEYLAAAAEEWRKRYPKGTYPAAMKRLSIHNPWEEQDAEYARARGNEALVR